MRPPKIGLIGRPETQRGLGIQTQEFAKHMPVAKVLQIHMPKGTGPRNLQVFSAPMVVDYEPAHHKLPRHAMREFLSGLDIVFTAETPYDWSMLEMADHMGVKTVIQGNPEFVRHCTPGYEQMPHPTEWWWPTTWRTDHLPEGKVIPVPMPTVDRLSPPFEGRLRIVHSVGKRAWQDRNGTDLFMQALGWVKGEVDVTIIGVDGELSPIFPQRNLRITLVPDGKHIRWDVYRGHHLLVLPRKYGGLCLPTLEAMAAGLAVMMPNCSPNNDWNIIPIPVSRYLGVMMSCGEVAAAYIDPQMLATMIDDLAANMHRVEAWADRGRDATLWWDEGGTDLYMRELSRVCES